MAKQCEWPHQRLPKHPGIDHGLCLKFRRFQWNGYLRISLAMLQPSFHAPHYRMTVSKLENNTTLILTLWHDSLSLKVDKLCEPQESQMHRWPVPREWLDKVRKKTWKKRTNMTWDIVFSVVHEWILFFGFWSESLSSSFYMSITYRDKTVCWLRYLNGAAILNSVPVSDVCIVYRELS